jgi:hypothetical protein
MFSVEYKCKESEMVRRAVERETKSRRLGVK